MTPRGSGDPGAWTAASRPDPSSAEWVRALASPGPERDAAIDRLYGILLLAARSEIRRRSGQLLLAGPEADDLAHQAAGDALMAISEKAGSFRGESRFMTWAYKFVMLEVSVKIGRHFWSAPRVTLDDDGWERLPDRIGLGPSEAASWNELVRALRDGIEAALTAHQRRVFVAVALDGVPIDALAAQMGATRNAIYKTVFDARRSLRAHLERAGHLPQEGAGRT